MLNGRNDEELNIQAWAVLAKYEFMGLAADQPLRDRRRRHQSNVEYSNGVQSSAMSDSAASEAQATNMNLIHSNFQSSLLHASGHPAGTVDLSCTG